MTNGQSVEPMTRFLFSVWWLRVSWCGAPSLMRGWVCNLLVQLLLGLARAVTLGSKSHRTQTTVSFETPPTLKARSLYLYPSGTGWPSYNPRHCTLPKLFKVRANMFNAQLIMLWHCSADWLAGINQNFPINMRECFPVWKTKITAGGIRHTDHMAPSIRKSWH
jgi:hypothetical protein